MAKVTARQFTIEQYQESDDAMVKMNAVFENHHTYTDCIKEEVIAYMAGHWGEWEREQPEVREREREGVECERTPRWEQTWRPTTGFSRTTTGTCTSCR